MKFTPNTEDLDALRARLSDNHPDKLVKIDAYLSLLATFYNDQDSGQDVDHLDNLRRQIHEARRALDT